jgi:NAD(P)-dependent dehydrogenase (short-subunit alcohol dehydrogenase family)
MNDFAGACVIVTGAAQGIGRAVAEAFAAAGAQVVIADRGEAGEAAAQAVREAGHQAIAVSTDVSDPEQTQAMAAAAEQAFGRIDVLVNNAGIFTSLLPQNFDEIPLEEWRRVMAVNVDGVFHCCRAVVPAMRRQGAGRIVNIGSAVAFKGNPLMLHYVTSKAAVLGLTRALARELGPQGILVNNVAPGYTLSEGMLGNSVQIARGREKNVRDRCVQRDMHPQDLVGAVMFLAGPQAGFVAGQTLVVDGGVALH